MITPASTCVVFVSVHSDSKRQKLEVVEDTSSDSSSDYDPEEIQQFNEEIDRNGYFDFDFSAVRNDFDFKQVSFDQSYLTHKPDTDGSLLERLSRLAINKYNEDNGTHVEFVNVLKANYHPGAGITLYITFEAKDVATHLHLKLYQTTISYLPMDIRVMWCEPKPDIKGLFL
ncbi:hypothetical protein V5N11_033794 [Cardamine amara subsp. amara]|uniref:Cystatin domain-containing protein n=1 Tax=Cardamine amara subsp. amara TaxID=228776 RepID=A0ABD1BB74_CARAN